MADAQAQELACTYAALILHDSGAEVTADKIAETVKAAGVTVEPFYPTLFANFPRSLTAQAARAARARGCMAGVRARARGRARAGADVRARLCVCARRRAKVHLI